MSETPLFGGSSEPSEKGLFNQPKKPATKSESNIFSDRSAKLAAKSDGLFAADSGSTEKSEKPAKPAKKHDPKRAKKLRKILFASVAAVLLLGGATSGLVYLFWYNSDEGILSSALHSLISSGRTDLIIDGALKASGSGEDEPMTASFSFSLGLLADGMNAALSLALKASYPEQTYTPGYYNCPGSDEEHYNYYYDAYKNCGFSYKYEMGHYDYDTKDLDLSGDAVYYDGDYYVKTDFSALADLIGDDFPDLGDYDGEWIRIAQDYLSELTGSDTADQAQTCMTDALKRYPNASNELYDILFSGDGSLFKLTSEGRKNGSLLYTLALSTELDDYLSALDTVWGMPIVSDAIDCYLEAQGGDHSGQSVTIGGQTISPGPGVSLNRDILNGLYKEGRKSLSRTDRKAFVSAIKDYSPQVSLTIDTSTRQLTNLNLYGEYDQVDLDLDLDFKTGTRSGEEILAPTKYKDLKTLLD